MPPPKKRRNKKKHSKFSTTQDKHARIIINMTSDGAMEETLSPLEGGSLPFESRQSPTSDCAPLLYIVPAAPRPSLRRRVNTRQRKASSITSARQEAREPTDAKLSVWCNGRSRTRKTHDEVRQKRQRQKYSSSTAQRPKYTSAIAHFFTTAGDREQV